MKIQVYIHNIRRAAEYIHSRFPSLTPRTAIVLGSGLSGAVPRLKDAKVIAYKDIPGFPATTVSGHAGRLVLGRHGSRGVAVLQGRFHYYEGHSMESITLPIRALEYLGLKTLVVTAAVGSLRPRIRPGHIVVIKDHINFMGRNPLRGFHEEEFGDMFPDLTNAYDSGFRRLALSVCRARKIPVHEGVYAAMGGPSYETPAEIRAFRALGADVTGMSVVPEVIVARQMGVRVLGLSWISNMAAGISREVLSHPDVLAMGEQVAARLKTVIENLLPRLGAAKS